MFIDRLLIILSLFQIIQSEIINDRVQSSLSRLLSSPGLSQSSPRVKFETYKALAGETIRLECPQPNPTWFFRRVNNNNLLNRLTTDTNKGSEDLIVTRHGIINADYKYKIMCHMTLKHKVIIVNNIDFDEEGLYTCLYTLPSETQSNSFYPKTNDLISSDNFNANLMQYRHVFNVTVYTLISGLTVNIKPISMRLSPMLTSNEFLNKKFQYDPQQSQQQQNNLIELIESTLTVRENEEFLFNCVVDSSKPAADIKFTVLNNVENQEPSPTFASSSAQSLLASLISSNTNIVKNSDKTFKTIYSARLKANLNDHGKTLTCNAENGFSNQKWENKKTLNVLFAPICYHKPNFVYYIGINQTLNVECRVLNANPSRLSYKWDLNNINGNINFNPNSLKNSENLIKDNHMPILPQAERLLNGDKNPNFQSSYFANIEYNKIYNTLESDSLTNRFKWKPNNLNDFGEIKCIASNEIGSTECVYELKLGGPPNPPVECNHILKNTSAIISCQVGFHQGDPDIYCYLLRKSDNGVYKEHTRNRESCSFIVNDINVNKFNEFWIYSSNKHGHNKDIGVHLTIGQLIKQLEPSNNKTFVLVAIGFGLVIFAFLGCGFCFKIRKSFSDDSDSVFDTDAYQPKSALNSSSPDLKKPNSFSSKMIKGVKVGSDSSYDINDHIKDMKLLKPSDLKKPYSNGTLNPGYNDKKRESYNENKGYLDYSKVYATRNDKNYQQFTNISRNKIDERKTTKFNLFKSTSTLPSNKTHRSEVKDLSITNLKTNAAQSYNQFDKLNNGLLIKDKSTSNSILSQDKNNLRMKKSISFTKSTQHNILSIDDPNFNKETMPFFKDKSSLLTTVSSNSKLLQHSKLSSNSVDSLTDSNLIQNNKMVTFGVNNSSASMRKYPKSNQSITTLTTAVISTTTTTTGSNSESSNDAGSNNTSTTSPTCSSSNNDSEFLDNSPIINSSITNSDFTSNSQSFLQSNSSLVLPKLNTFSSKKEDSMCINQTQRTNDKLPPLPSNSPKNRKSNDFLEAKFLNKLCEEIEVSLNVDCECADDYSSNDFSGDYSFDNDLVIRAPNKNNYSNALNTTNNKVNYLTDLRKNFELNIKQLRNCNTNSNYNPNKQNNVRPTSMTKPNFDTNQNQQPPTNKTNLGVLV